MLLRLWLRLGSLHLRLRPLHGAHVHLWCRASGRRLRCGLRALLLLRDLPNRCGLPGRLSIVRPLRRELTRLVALPTEIAALGLPNLAALPALTHLSALQ